MSRMNRFTISVALVFLHAWLCFSQPLGFLRSQYLATLHEHWIPADVPFGLHIYQWFLTSGVHASPRGVNKFPGGRELVRAVQRRKFSNDEVFRPVHLFKVWDAW